jgi:hypothetical protein
MVAFIHCACCGFRIAYTLLLEFFWITMMPSVYIQSDMPEVRKSDRTSAIHIIHITDSIYYIQVYGVTDDEEGNRLFDSL